MRARVLALVAGGVERRTLRIPIASARLINAVEKRCVVHERRYVDDPSHGQAVELDVEIGDRQIEALLPMGEFLVDGNDARPKRAGWGSGKRKPPHLVDDVES